MLDRMPKQGGEQATPAEARRHREESALGSAAAGRKMLVEGGDLGVEREGALEAQGEHAGELAAVERDDVVILLVETVHETSVGIRRVLGNLFDEGLVVQAMDRLEFPILRREFKLEGRSGCSWRRGIKPAG